MPPPIDKGSVSVTEPRGFVYPDQRIVVSAVIPCLNEAQTIGLCIEKAFLGLEALGIRGEVIVSDNGSIDDSARIAERLNARVVREQRKGYGAALARGINAARGQIIVMGDADDSYDWSAIAPFVWKIQEGYDLVMGNRFRGGVMRGAMPPLHRYLGNPVLSWIARVAFRTDVGDFHCGMRAFTKNAFHRMAITSSGMEFATEMVANAACHGLRIAEVPTKLYPDKRNHPPHLRSFHDGWRHLRFILTYAPDHLYLIPGISLFLLGLVVQILLSSGPIHLAGVYMGIRSLSIGSLLTLFGFNIVSMGMLAKAMMAHRYIRLTSRMTHWVTHRFTLEAGLLVGVILFVTAFGVDAVIAADWLRTLFGSMDKTAYLFVIATTMLVLGLNLVFSSFLLHMILQVNSESKWVGTHDIETGDGSTD